MRLSKIKVIISILEGVFIAISTILLVKLDRTPATGSFGILGYWIYFFIFFGAAHLGLVALSVSIYLSENPDGFKKWIYPIFCGFWVVLLDLCVYFPDYFKWIYT